MPKTTKITLYNDFHNTEVTLLIPATGPRYLSPQQIRRARKTLCGHRDCCCSGDLGTRGPQDANWEPTFEISRS